ncbi:hypothetical protein Tco_0177820, partial [Tanacetum coccineum]
LKCEDYFTTTIGSIPGELSGLSLATCRWGYVSLGTCRWGIIAGETSSGIQSPTIIPSEEVDSTHFSVKEVVPRWHKFPRRQVAGILFLYVDKSTHKHGAFVV